MKKTAKWYRKVLSTLGITQKQAAEILNVNPRTSRRYALGETAVPFGVASILEDKLEKHIRSVRRKERMAQR